MRDGLRRRQNFPGSAGKLRIYSGTRPANVAASITGTLLADLTLGSPFAPAASAGVLTANAVPEALL